MAKRLNLKAKTRANLGRNQVKKLRSEGKVPAVMYGQADPLALEVSSMELVQNLHTVNVENCLVDLEIEGEKGAKKHLALLNDIQIHPIQDKVLHVDFHEINPDQKITAEVAVEQVGEALGVRVGGGILDHLLRHLRVECLPKDLPSSIEVNVDELDVGESISVGQIPLPEGVKVLNSPDVHVFMIHKSRAATAAAASSGAADQAAASDDKKEEGEQK